MVKVGKLIGDRYEILEKIGTGGMSDVYKAKCHKLNRYVAVKVLKQEFNENANFVSKFRSEAQAAAGLMHPNIVNVYDVGEDEGIYFIVMELVEGITLKRYIEKKNRLSYKEAVSIAIQVSMGIEAAHANHIIHRDIKPQNIMISREGKVKVTDFGIAKAATSNTITSNVMGSVHYTSPEQARGGYSDEKSDIYSLGVTLFEMVTGRVPFNGDSTVAIAIKHIQEAIPSPREFVEDVPTALESIILKCCQKSPDRRYQNMRELVSDLKKSLMYPEADFVVRNQPDLEGSTRTVSEEELEQIKKKTAYREVKEDRVRPERTVQEKRVQREKAEAVQRKNKSAQKRGGYLKSDLDDEDDEYDYDPRMERVTTVLAVVAGVIICAILFFFVTGVFEDFGKSGLIDSSKPLVSNDESGEVDESKAEEEADVKAVEMPLIVGWRLSDAKRALEKQSFRVNVEYEESDDVAADVVIEANYEYGDMVPLGSIVVLKVSQGPSVVLVAQVTGMTLADAQLALGTQGLQVQVDYGFSDIYTEGIVMSQNPVEGTEVEPESMVTIRVSQGSSGDTLRVPHVIGMTEAAGTQALWERGIGVSSISHVSHATIPAGCICYQSYSQGSYLTPGSGIEIHISTGPGE